MKRLRSYIILLFLGMTLISWSQQENRLIRQGNRQYDDGNYKEAEIDYLKSVQSKNSSHKGFFNLGNAWYMQNNYVQAAAAFDTLRTFKMNDETRSNSYYNLGNSLLKASKDSAQLAQKFLPASIESYKQALRLNPDDQDAKYNLAYAQKLLQKSQQEQQQQQQNKDQKQDQKQDQDQKQEQKEQEQQEQEQEQQQQEQQQQQQQAQPQQISKEDAERILEALKNDEKETLEKLKQAKIQSTRVIKTDKDW